MLGSMYAIANILMNGAQHYNIIYIPKNGHLYVTHITFYFLLLFVCLFSNALVGVWQHCWDKIITILTTSLYYKLVIISCDSEHSHDYFGWCYVVAIGTHHFFILFNFCINKIYFKGKKWGVRDGMHSLYIYIYIYNDLMITALLILSTWLLGNTSCLYAHYAYAVMHQCSQPGSYHTPFPVTDIFSPLVLN